MLHKESGGSSMLDRLLLVISIMILILCVAVCAGYLILAFHTSLYEDKNGLPIIIESTHRQQAEEIH